MRALPQAASAVFVVMLLVLSGPAEGDGVPDWLGGRPDTEIEADRCGVYRWFLDEADRQTGGAASGDDLAYRRVINIANKLVEHHRSSPQERYGAEIRYLVIGDPGPLHFEFDISESELERMLDEDCGQ